MSKPSSNWQKIFAVLVVLVLVATAFQTYNTEAKPAPAFKSLKGDAQKPVASGVTQPLSALAEKMGKSQNADGPIPVVPENAPYVELRGNFQIPRQIRRVTPPGPMDIPGRTFSRGGFIEPDKRLFDDPPAPGVDWQWAGLSQGVNRVWYGYGVYPPDTQGDLGPANYIQVVNIQMAIYDLTTPSQVGTPRTLFAGPINVLWKSSGLTACAESEDGDPIVLYDELADRWLLSQFALPNYGVPGGPHYECIAVSATGDPMGPWYAYQYAFPVMNDYPHFGVWHDSYYMSINQFKPETSPSWAGQGVVAFDKAAMLAGNPAAGMIYIDTYASCVLGTEPECYLGGMLPADADGATPSSGPGIFMQYDDDAWGYSPDQLQIWTFTPDWVAGTGTFTHQVDLTTAPFDSEVCYNYSRNCIPQFGTPVGLDAIADRLMYRLQWRDFGTYQAMVVNHTIDVTNTAAPAKGQAGVRWYELRDSGSGWGIYQQGNIAPDTKNRWMASAAMDGVGNIAFGYSVSDATMYPGIRYTVHLASDPLGTTRSETTLVTGGGAQLGTGYRWGDYSMMSVFPAGYGDAGCDFVYTTEYHRGSTAAEWYTWLGWFHNASCYNNDTGAPDTVIDTKPANPSNSHSASFTFHGTDSISGTFTYECSLDGGAFATCSSPATYNNLQATTHTFQVRAIDASKNIDPTPASYTWDVSFQYATFTSQAPYDGFVLEKAKDSGVGILANASAGLIYLGDTSVKQQYKGFLSFDTSSLPNNAVVTGVFINMKATTPLGVDPFTTHGALAVDITKPLFGPSIFLTAGDFQYLVTYNNVATCGSPAAGSYTCSLNSGFTDVNLLGTTQFRMYFTTKYDADSVTDVARIYSGNSLNVALRPTVTVEYYIP